MPGIFIPNIGCNFFVPHQLLRNRFFFFLNDAIAFFHILVLQTCKKKQKQIYLFLRLRYKVKTTDRNKCMQ